MQRICTGLGCLIVADGCFQPVNRPFDLEQALIRRNLARI